jgi:AAA family ATP:ADP antiporter
MPWVARIAKVEAHELTALAWSFVYFFCLLCGYSVLRPVREEMAIQGGVQHLPWLMTGTFLTLLLATPFFGWLTARYTRRTLLPTVYLFFAANLLFFYVAMTSGVERAWVARVFFIWLSVFNLFVVSVFWSFMVDLFTPAQGLRLFGMIAAGGSSGALVGPVITGASTYVVGIANLMLLSALFLLACIVCIRRLDRWANLQGHGEQSGVKRPLGGSIWAGIKLAFSSSYLGGISVYLVLLSATSTFLYLETLRFVGEEFASSAERTRLFAGIDLATNSLTVATQVFVTNRLPLTVALLLLPVVSAVGFVLMGTGPTLALLVGLSVVRRVGEYAIGKPGREVLFTVVSREEKYKAKNFMDTAVARGGDASSSWLVTSVKALGATTAQIAWALVPIALCWALLGAGLSRQHRTKSPLGVLTARKIA